MKPSKGKSNVDGEGRKRNTHWRWNRPSHRHRRRVYRMVKRSIKQEVAKEVREEIQYVNVALWYNRRYN
jgi:hypothetical protein